MTVHSSTFTAGAWDLRKGTQCESVLLYKETGRCREMCCELCSTTTTTVIVLFPRIQQAYVFHNNFLRIVL